MINDNGKCTINPPLHLLGLITFTSKLRLEDPSSILLTMSWTSDSVGFCPALLIAYCNSCMQYHPSVINHNFFVNHVSFSFHAFASSQKKRAISFTVFPTFIWRFLTQENIKKMHIFCEGNKIQNMYARFLIR